MPDSAELPVQPSAALSSGHNEIARLRGENVALQSLLYGLCVGLSQMGEVQREVIRQAFDYADRSPMALALKDVPDNAERSCNAYAATIGTLRDLIISRIRTGGF